MIRKITADGVTIWASNIEGVQMGEPKLTQELNRAGSLEFTIYPGHPQYDSLKKMKTTLRVFEDDECIWEGRIIDDTIKFNKAKAITAEGALAYLNDSIQPQARYNFNNNLAFREYLQALINKHNAQVKPDRQFTLGIVSMAYPGESLFRYTNNENTLKEIQEDLVEDYGGYIRIRIEGNTRYLDYLEDYGNTNTQTIELGENLLDLSKKGSVTDICNRVIPLGETLEEQKVEGLDARLELNLDGKNYVESTQAQELYGIITKVEIFDGITTQEGLRRAAQKYLEDSQWENLILEVKAIDLNLVDEAKEKFKIGDWIRVISEPHGLNRNFELSRITKNLADPAGDTITLGKEEKKRTLSAATSQATVKLDLISKNQISQSVILNMAKDNATELINAATHGHVVTEPNRLLIMDTDDPATATKIWQWNLNGLGYSEDGGNTYGTAITMDGSIIADYITAGTMTADRVRGGEFIVGGSGLAKNGQITIEDANNNTVGTWNKDGIRLIKGLIGGFKITDRYIQGFNNGDYENSTIYCEMGSWHPQWQGDGYAFAIWMRGSTSENYRLKWGIDYNGHMVSDIGLDIYPSASQYGMHCHGKLYSEGDISTEGQIYCHAQLYADGHVSGDVAIGRVGLNCSAGGTYSYGDIYSDGSIGCRGSKNRIVDTEHYGYRAMHAYETATPYFGDIGEGKINADGECIIYIDDIFYECIDADSKYQVFLQKYGQGDIWVDARENNYFVVKGTPNISFGWEIKAIQKNYDSVRLDMPSDSMTKTILEQYAE